MLRSYQLRLRVNQEQGISLVAILADSCETYNAALQERKEAWKLQRKRITYFDQTKELAELRKDPAFATIASEIQREPLRRVDRAFKAFFRRCKTSEKPGYPRYRSRRCYDSFAMSTCFDIDGNRLRITKLSTFRFDGHRELTGRPKHLTVKRVGKRWVARLLCDIGPAPDKLPISNAVGIDLGLTTFATLSDGSEVPNPRFTGKHAQAIARAHKNLARKKRGSKNRLRAREQVRRAYQRMADARKNFCHHVSKQLINTYNLIAHEDLKISNMVRSTFAKSIMDAAWGILLFQLAYKAESAGRYVIAVNPRGTSQKCSGCGAIVRKKLSERQHVCDCGLLLGRDHNAALNILALGRSAVGVSAEGSK